MSELTNLIKSLCPAGVAYKDMGEIGAFYGGLSGKSKSDFVDGNAAFITYRNIYSNPALNIHPKEKVKISAEEKQNIVEYRDILFTGSSETPDECAFSSVVCEQPTENLYLNSFCFGYRLNNPDLFEPGFLKHYFRGTEFRKAACKCANGTTRFNVSKKMLAKVPIPVPPIAVQRKIVEVLDNFSELTAELTAELEKRKLQYEYYRDNLLSFNDIGGGYKVE